MMASIKTMLHDGTIQDTVVVYDPAMQTAFAAKKILNETPSSAIKTFVKKIIET